MNLKHFMVVIAMITLIASNLHAQAAKERSEIPEKYRWRTTDIYPDITAWQKDFESLKTDIDKLTAFKGRFAGDKAVEVPKALIEFNKLSDELGKKFEHVYTYVAYNGDVDLANSEWDGRNQQVQMLWVDYSQKLAWLEPELLKIPQETMRRFIAENPALKDYEKYYNDMYLRQAHVLSEKEEEILALAGNIVETSSDVFGKLTDVDLKFGSIQVPRRDENGNPVKDANGNALLDSVEVSDAGYVNWRTDPDRQIRQDYHNKLFSGYNEYGTTIAALMNGNVMKNVFYAKARKYDNTLQAALFSTFVPEKVYTNLVETARKNSAPLHKYNEVRRRILGVDHYRHWDYYAGLFKEPEKRYTWEEGVAIVVDALRPLGEQYVKDIAFGLNPGSGWVDPFYSKGKRGGAYSGSSYMIHPFMLYNFDVDKGLNREDVSTVAHEVGHSMHTYYSEREQPYVNYGYAIFNAEVASTTNEALLNAKLLREAREAYKKAKKGPAKDAAKQNLMSLLEANLSGARDTFYRQTMFADFELAVNRMGENSQPITKESLDTLYLGLLNTYQGPALEYEPLSSVEWERIPHFYRGYYVYTYATSYAAAMAIAEKIQTEERLGKHDARDRYLNYLASGSSKHPVELLQDAGVDMSTPAPIEACTRWFSGLVDELDALSKTPQGQ
jgi:oligoendopeptidase F